MRLFVRTVMTSAQGQCGESVVTPMEINSRVCAGLDSDNLVRAPGMRVQDVRTGVLLVGRCVQLLKSCR